MSLDSDALYHVRQPAPDSSPLGQTVRCSDLGDAFAEEACDRPEPAYAPTGAWDCGNEACNVREVRVACTYDETPPQPPALNCPQCGGPLTFQGYLREVALVRAGASPADAELDGLDQLARKATPGPWVWDEERWNDAVAPLGRSGRRRARPGRSVRETFVYYLRGPARGGVHPPCDPWDYHVVCALQWSQVRGDTLCNCHPEGADAELIARAREALPRLVAEVRRLRAELARRPLAAEGKEARP
jgi:hypothetical protein